MAKPIEQFMKLFSGLKINPGTIVSLAEGKIPLTKNVTSLPLDLFFERLKDVILDL